MSRPRRLREFDYFGLHHYFVTVCVLDRRAVFTDAAVVESAQSHFLKQAVRFACAILAYCFMPDHVHLLVDGTLENADLQSFVARAKQKSGFDFAAGHHHRLWQKGYYDRVLRDDEPIPDVIRYISNNPVRAGLVVEPVEYPFWGSGVYTRDELIEFIAIDRPRHR
jgi:putative transposase